MVVEAEDGGDHDRTIRRLGHWGSYSWNVFRHMIRPADTGRRFSSLSAVLGPGDLTPPHSHKDEDEFTLVFRGRIGGRAGDHDVVVEEGGFLFKPRGIVHTLWNPTDVEAIVIEIISPPGLEEFFEEIGGLLEGRALRRCPRSALSTD